MSRSVSLWWNNSVIVMLVVVLIGGISGTLMALLMPRGPVTSSQALILIGTGAVAGVLSGVVMRSRWAMLLAPLSHLAAFEFGRRGETGPTVDGIHLGTMYGILAFLLSRGVYVVLALLPIVLGVVYGMMLARRLGGESRSFKPRRSVRVALKELMTGFSTGAIVALAIWIALPASVPPVRGADGKVIPGSVAELTKVRLGGHEQWIEIRGASADKPVLLYLSGGPGQSDLPYSRVLFDDLTKDFLVVGWDQRGTGKSYPALDPETLTLERAIGDTVELTNYLRERFQEEKIYLIGESWGTLLAVLAAQQHPELYHAVISSGQMVSVAESDRIIYADLLAYAQREGDADLAKTLHGFGPPPYKDVWAYGVILQNYPKLVGDYDSPAGFEERGAASGIGFMGIMGSEYTPIEKVNVMRGLIDLFATMYPQLQQIDFRTDVPKLDVPIYLFHGEHELRGRTELAMQWYNQVQAPRKAMYTFSDAGHSAAFEEFQELHRILIETILPETYPA